MQTGHLGPDSVRQYSKVSDKRTAFNNGTGPRGDIILQKV